MVSTNDHSFNILGVDKSLLLSYLIRVPPHDLGIILGKLDQSFVWFTHASILGKNCPLGFKDLIS